MTVNDTLLEAAIKGDAQGIEDAIASGANVNAKGKNGNTALHLAVQNGHVIAVKLLFANGADVKAEKKNHVTPLHYACGGDLEEFVQDKKEPGIEAGLELHIFWHELKTYIHEKAASFEWHKDIAEFLINKGADVNAKARDDFTPAGCAALIGKKDIVEFLISKGADVKEDFTLTAAAAFGNTDIAEFLINKDADVNGHDSSRITPLMVAAWLGNKESAEFLVSKGADVNAKDSEDLTALIAAVIFGDKDVVELLINAGADVTVKFKGDPLLHIASLLGCTDVAMLLIEKGAKIDGQNDKGETPLMVAIKHGKIETAKSLAEKAHSIAVNSWQKELEAAESKGYTEVVKIIKEGKDIPNGEANKCQPCQPCPSELHEHSEALKQAKEDLTKARIENFLVKKLKIENESQTADLSSILQKIDWEHITEAIKASSDKSIFVGLGAKHIFDLCTQIQGKCGSDKTEIQAALDYKPSTNHLVALNPDVPKAVFKAYFYQLAAQNFDSAWPTIAKILNVNTLKIKAESKCPNSQHCIPVQDDAVENIKHFIDIINAVDDTACGVVDLDNEATHVVKCFLRRVTSIDQAHADQARSDAIEKLSPLISLPATATLDEVRIAIKIKSDFCIGHDQEHAVDAVHKIVCGETAPQQLSDFLLGQ